MVVFASVRPPVGIDVPGTPRFVPQLVAAVLPCVSSRLLLARALQGLATLFSPVVLVRASHVRVAACRASPCLQRYSGSLAGVLAWACLPRRSG